MIAPPHMPDTSHSFFVTCERGTEGALRRELVALAIHAPRGAHGGVSFSGTFEQGMRICLFARTAMRVLMRIGAGNAANAEELYALAHAIDWTQHLDDRHTFAVRAAVANSQTLVHSGFVALKVKDAIVDRLRDTLGKRPDVNADDPDVTVAVHINGQEARLFLDLSGEPLHRRGYRVAMTDAPLKETLAASMLSLASVSGDEPFCDPMCGSGTLAIEHALRARGVPPGTRRSFSFERWPDQQHQTAWRQIRREADERALARAPEPIFARDLDPAAVEAARRNAAAAGVEQDIRFEVADAGSLTLPEGTAPGTVMFNPPYGERLPDADDRRRRGAGPRQVARALSLLWGWRIAVLSPHTGLAEALGLNPDFTHRLSNGGVDVLLQRYSLGHREGDA